MTLPDLLLLRLSHQQISHQRTKTPPELVAWMGAMQAQDFNMVRWALGLRLPGIDYSAIQKSIDKGEIIRTHVMRPTWHLIAASDATWMLDLTAPHIKASLTPRLRGLELTPLILKKAVSVLEKKLEGNVHMTREAVLDLFGKNKIPTQEQRASHILMWAELEKVICNGAIQGKKNTYALFSERVKYNNSMTREEALGNLASRYFNSHGPAALQDFLNWSGLPAADGRKAIGLIGNDFLSELIDGRTYWFKKSRLQKRNTAYLLPAFDEFIIGYKDRSACLLGQHRSTAIGVNGMFFPVIVVNGQVIGLWKRTVARDHVTVELNYFRGLKPKSESVRKMIDKAVAQVKEFFEGGL